MRDGHAVFDHTAELFERIAEIWRQQLDQAQKFKEFSREPSAQYGCGMRRRWHKTSHFPAADLCKERHRAD